MRWLTLLVLLAGCNERAVPLPTDGGAGPDSGGCYSFSCRYWYVPIDGGIQDGFLERLYINDELCSFLCHTGCVNDPASCEYDPRYTDDGGVRVRCHTYCL